MSAVLLSFLPGDIPGLLRRGSPVHWRDEQTPFVVAWIGPWPDADLEDGAIVQAAPCGYGLISIEDTARNFALDLTDATGRAHAAAWGWRKAYPSGVDFTTADDRAVKLLSGALRFEPATPEQIDVLCRLCLRLAGRSHV